MSLPLSPLILYILEHLEYFSLLRFFSQRNISLSSSTITMCEGGQKSNIVFGTCNMYFTQFRGLRYWNEKVSKVYTCGNGGPRTRSLVPMSAPKWHF